MGGTLIIRIDQQSLKFMMTQKLSEGIQQKLLIKLLEFNYTSEYKKDKENSVVDALSRKHFCQAITTAKPSWIDDIEKSYVDDNHCQQLLQQLAVNPKKFSWLFLTLLCS